MNRIKSILLLLLGINTLIISLLLMFFKDNSLRIPKTKYNIQIDIVEYYPEEEQTQDLIISDIYDVYNLDMTIPCGVSENDFRTITQGNLIGYEKVYLHAEEIYHVNAILLYNINALESGYGTSELAVNNNNLGGIRESMSLDFVEYDSFEESIMSLARLLGEEYLDQDGMYYNGKDIRSINMRYSLNEEDCTVNWRWSEKLSEMILDCYMKINKNVLPN